MEKKTTSELLMKFLKNETWQNKGWL